MGQPCCAGSLGDVRGLVALWCSLSQCLNSCACSGPAHQNNSRSVPCSFEVASLCRDLSKHRACSSLDICATLVAARAESSMTWIQSGTYHTMTPGSRAGRSRSSHPLPRLTRTARSASSTSGCAALHCQNRVTGTKLELTHAAEERWHFWQRLKHRKEDQQQCAAAAQPASQLC